MMEPDISLHVHRYQDISEKRGGAGVLILSGNRCLHFLNRRGLQLIQEINRAQSMERGALLPRMITELYAGLQRLASEHTEREWERLEVRRVASASIGPILLRGFACPGQKERLPFMAIILIERVCYREMNLEGVDQLRLSNREYEVVRNLVKGWTNKEIACELDISEHTVKGHIRQIMIKLGTTTRTGILSKVLAAWPYPSRTARVGGGGTPDQMAPCASGRRFAGAPLPPP